MKLWSTLGQILKGVGCRTFLPDVFREFAGTTLFLFASLSSVVLWPHVGPQAWESTTADPLLMAEDAHECVPDPLHVSLAFGASLALTCVCLGGVHLNPAVTLALAAGLRVSPWQAVLYVGAQLLGAITACGLLLCIAPVPLRDKLGINELASGVHLSQAFSVETAVTFQLVLCVLAVTHPKSPFFSLAPAALGLSVTLGHLIAIGFTGCGMNPARSFGPAVVTLNFENHWVFWAGPSVGAILAWMLHDLLLCPRWASLSDWLKEFRQVFFTAPSKQPTSSQGIPEI